MNPVFAGEEFREFWNATHPTPLAEYGFDPDSANHYAFERRNGSGMIDSALILVPYVEDGRVLGHHVHLCSRLRSKALFAFCRAVMDAARGIDGIGLVCAETQGLPEYRRAGRVAAGCGFSPVWVRGWTDFLWNSKAA